MQIETYEQKKEIIARYRASTCIERATVERGAPNPRHVELSFDGQTFSFTLSDTETALLFTEFSAISIEDLFNLLGA